MSETTQNAATTETKTTKGKTAKKPVKAKAAAPKTRSAKAAKPPREKKEKVAMRTFAIRVTDAELAAIHKAAGPRNATKHMRAVAAAFAAGDDAAFKAVVKEAREARQ